MSRTWSSLSPTQQRLILLGSAAEVVLTTIAAVDLKRRPAAQVRGRKPLWALALVVQPVGPIAYLLAHHRAA